jgi:hypothetical protein
MALQTGTWNQGVQIYHSFGWLMMWRRDNIIGGSMMTTYNPWRTLGMERDAHQGRQCHLNLVGLVANMFPFL